MALNIIFIFIHKDEALSMDDLSDVYTKFYGARDKWFEIGLAFKIGFTTLKSIEREQLNDQSKCLREMLARRIQSGGPLTWADLCNCLRHLTVERNDLANEIDQGRLNLSIKWLLTSCNVLFLTLDILKLRDDASELSTVESTECLGQ